MGRAPMAHPPGSDTRARPKRAEQRPEHQHRGAHLADQLVRRLGQHVDRRVDPDHVAARRPDPLGLDAHRPEQLEHGGDVRQVGDVPERVAPSPRRAAAIRGRAAFLLPETRTSPSSRVPPSMWIWSKGSVSWVRGRRAAGVRPEGQPIVSGEVAFDADGAISGPLEQGMDRRSLPVADLQRQQPARHQPPWGSGDDAPDQRPARRRPRRALPAARVRTSAERVASSAVGTYGGLATTTSKGASPSTGAKRSPTRTSTRSAAPSAAAFARATSAAPGEISVATSRAARPLERQR